MDKKFAEEKNAEEKKNEGKIRVIILPDGSTAQQVYRKNLATKKYEWMSIQKR